VLCKFLKVFVKFRIYRCHPVRYTFYAKKLSMFFIPVYFSQKESKHMVEIPTRDPVFLHKKPPNIVIYGLLVSLSPPVGIADQAFHGFGFFPQLVPTLQQNADGRGALK
jgi:hypothetical protein